MSNPYLLVTELRAIADLAEFLNEDAFSDLGVNATIFDANGEVVGYVRHSDSGEYALHSEAEDE